MKAPLGNRSIEGRLSLILILLLAIGAWTFSISSAQQETQQSKGQTAAKPPVPAGDSQQPPSTPQDAGQSSAPQLQGTAAPAPEPSLTDYPPDYIPLIKKRTTSLMAPNFTFIPVKALDPFVPFVSLETRTQPRLPEEEDDRQAGAPLTPLQKMTLTEITSGLKAITWGELGKRAVIEDSTGKGYIVSVGTPTGEHSGVITQIFNDRLVIQQQVWDRKARKRFPQDFTIKLAKKTDDTR